MEKTLYEYLTHQPWVQSNQPYELHHRVSGNV